MVYIGIDPGVSGGLAAVESGGRLIDAVKMPNSDWDVYCWIKGYSECHRIAAIESIPPAVGYKNDKGQGSSKSSMSKLYGSYRALLMALTIAEVETQKLRLGEVWRAFGIPPKYATESKTQWKNRLKVKSQSIFPTAKITLATCDAILFAEYLRRCHEGVLLAEVKRIGVGEAAEL